MTIPNIKVGIYSFTKKDGRSMANLTGLEINIHPVAVQEIIDKLNEQMRVFEYSNAAVTAPIERLSGSGSSIPAINEISQIFDDMLIEINTLYWNTLQLLTEAQKTYVQSDVAASQSLYVQEHPGVMS